MTAGLESPTTSPVIQHVAVAAGVGRLASAGAGSGTAPVGVGATLAATSVRSSSKMAPSSQSRMPSLTLVKVRWFMQDQHDPGAAGLPSLDSPESDLADLPVR